MRITFAPFLLVAALPLSVAFLAPNQNSPAPGAQANKIMLFQATPYEVKPGDTIVLKGSGFNVSSNNVHFGTRATVAATSTGGTLISVTVPAFIPHGDYDLSVSNNLGSSNTANNSAKVSIKVTSSPRTPPTITSASVSGSTVTLIGEGFSSSNNLVTTLGTLGGVSSFDGRSISFQLNNLSEYARVKQQLKNKNIQTSIWIHINNDRGTSNDPYKLDIVL
jgi:hypothetical protein